MCIFIGPPYRIPVATLKFCQCHYLLQLIILQTNFSNIVQNCNLNLTFKIG